MIPCDIVANSFIVETVIAAKAKPKLSVYHCTSSTCNPVTMDYFFGQGVKFLMKQPLDIAVGEPTLKFIKDENEYLRAEKLFDMEFKFKEFLS